MDRTRLWTKDFLMVFAANFLLFCSFYMLIVTLAIHAAEQFHASKGEAGVASGIFVLGAVLVRPIAGRLMETVGKRNMLLFGLALFLVMILLYFPITSLTLLLIIRFIHGFAFGISQTATGTIAADIIPLARRGEGMGYFATSMNLAMAIGPFVGLFLSQHYDGYVIFGVTSVLSAIALITALFLRAPRTEMPVDMPKTSGLHLRDFFEKTTIPIGILAAICGMVYSSILSFLSTYAQEIRLVEAASFFFMMYALFLLLSRPFTGRLFDRKGENVVMYPSLLLFAAGLALLSQAQNGITLLIAGAVIGVGMGTIQSSAQTIGVNEAPRHRIGLATATFFVFYDFGVGIGPFLLGSILPFFGFRGLYALMAAITLFCLFVYYVVHGKKAAARRKSGTERMTG